MGFEVGRKITLEFEGYMEGAEITLRAASIATMLELRELTAVGSVPLLAEHLISWNLELDGVPVPMTAEAITTTVEHEMLYKIVGKWYEVATGVSAPLDPPSESGQESPEPEAAEQSIPMEIL
jgi:hypothetical protein